MSLVESVLDRPHFDDESLPLQHSQATSAKRFTRSHRPRWQDVDLIVTATPEGRTVQHRPLSRSDLPKADQEAPMKISAEAQPFGLVNMAAIYQEAMRDRYADQIGHIHTLAELDPPRAD